MAAKKQEPDVIEIDGVPTAAGLARRGRDLAYARPDGKYVITPEGHALIGAELRANAQERIMRGDSDWVQPPSSGKERESS